MGNGSFVRKAAYQQLRATASVVEHLTGLPIERWHCDSITQTMLAPLRQGEAKSFSGDGRLLVRKVDPDTGVASMVASPKGWLGKRWPILNLTLDHCLVGSSGMYCILDKMYLTTVTFDWFHQLWNNTKNALKRSEAGRMWKHVLAFMTVANFNHGPFRSGAWFVDKGDALDFYLGTHKSDDPDFQDQLELIAEDFKMPATTPDDIERVWNHMRELRSFREKGPALKLQRWGSIHECWDWYEPELRASRLVISEMAGESKSAAAPSNDNPCTAAGHRDHLAALAKSKGTLKLLPLCAKTCTSTCGSSGW